MSLLALSDVSKRFGGVNALADVSFAVEQGDVLGIIGPNGAGKTTLLNCISGLYHLDTGDIRWESASIRGLAPHRIEALSQRMSDRKSTRLNSSHEWISYAVF